MLSVPDLAGHKISVAFEDARAAHVNSEITDMIQEAIDKLDEDIGDVLSEFQSESSEEKSLDDHQTDDLYDDLTYENISYDEHSDSSKER